MPVLMALRALLQDYMDHHMHTHVAAHAEGAGKRACRSPDGKRSPPPMDTQHYYDCGCVAGLKGWGIEDVKGEGSKSGEESWASGSPTHLARETLWKYKIVYQLESGNKFFYDQMPVAFKGKTTKKEEEKNKKKEKERKRLLFNNDGAERRPLLDIGLPQGSPLRPVLCFLHPPRSRDLNQVVASSCWRPTDSSSPGLSHDYNIIGEPKVSEVLAINYVDASSFPVQNIKSILQCSGEQFRRDHISLSDSLLQRNRLRALYWSTWDKAWRKMKMSERAESDLPRVVFVATLKRRNTTPSGQKSENRNISWLVTWSLNELKFWSVPQHEPAGVDGPILIYLTYALYIGLQSLLLARAEAPTDFRLLIRTGLVWELQPKLSRSERRPVPSRVSGADPDLKSEVIMSDIKLLGQTIPRMRVLLKPNTQMVSAQSELQTVFTDLMCTKCISCMERALKANKIQTHMARIKPNTQEIENDVIVSYFNYKPSRTKRSTESIGVEAFSNETTSKINLLK
ncbi:hypothetical protein MSG28_012413 [Choristoneura fumiferana]|uniref:Uncharacterized protein n=1 Tax=Choristoneura fumiferana TaxID=7141 RepID=A0ACC0KDQ0_CHOFU|nr:hypothetical protein MSG28_012413 [Choristoneura fumiferana]